MTPIISTNIRIRYPKYFVVGDYSIVDDFCYFSTQVQIGRGTHIANGVSVGGGPDRKFTVGDFCSLSAGVRIWCTSDDFVRDVVAILPQGMPNVKTNLITGDVIFENYTAVGANSVVMPDNHIPEGTTIGALSFVPVGFKFEPWSVYAGNPIRKVRDRDRKSVLEQVRQIEAFLKAREAG